jgi:hypothetical protein
MMFNIRKGPEIDLPCWAKSFVLDGVGSFYNDLSVHILQRWISEVQGQAYEKGFAGFHVQVLESKEGNEYQYHSKAPAFGEPCTCARANIWWHEKANMRKAEE